MYTLRSCMPRMFTRFHWSTIFECLTTMLPTLASGNLPHLVRIVPYTERDLGVYPSTQRKALLNAQRFFCDECGVTRCRIGVVTVHEVFHDRFSMCKYIFQSRGI